MSKTGETNETNETNEADNAMSVDITELRTDLDLDDPRCSLKIAAERLSIVRYVFLVQIEDGIASATQRASLEYADAVLIGWPEETSSEVVDLDVEQLNCVRSCMEMMEEYISKFAALEREGDVESMTDTLIRITERVAEVRRMYQPDFPLPTFAEIRRVVQDEWDEDMGKIIPMDDNPTAQDIKQEREIEDREELESKELDGEELKGKEREGQGA